MSAVIPTSVLGDALSEALAGRVVRAAVFTTFSFEPGFFEESVLPLLFPEAPFHQVRKVRMLQLEDALASCGPVAVYYDRSALSPDAEPARLGVHRIGVRRTTGVFHPKLVMILVEDPDEDAEDGDDPPLSLVVGALSANLTRHGWWEAVEAGHFEEICDKSRADAAAPYRKDLLSIVGRLKRLGSPDEPHDALSAVHRFLREQTETQGAPVRHSVRRQYYTRMFYGQKALPEWLEDLRLWTKGVNLEIVSPFFDKGTATTVEAVAVATSAESVRIYLPRDDLGEADVDRALYDAVDALPGVVWGDLPPSVLERTGGSWAGERARRGVHAKVYRFWNTGGLDVVLVGSVNCTSAGMSHAGAGNLEAAFLVDQNAAGTASPRWWLQPLEREPTSFQVDPPAEEDAAVEGAFEGSVRFDWQTQVAEVCLHDPVGAPLLVESLSGGRIDRIDRVPAERWIPLSSEGARELAELLKSTSFVRLRAGEATWTVLVQEQAWAYRPSLLATLSAEEILLYWSLLSPEQKVAFLESRVITPGDVEGLVPVASSRYLGGDTLFDRFAGLFHAFGQLWSLIAEALGRGRELEVTARVFGARYDSLPVLLDRIDEEDGRDAVMGYLTYLCARQLAHGLAREHPDYWARNAEGAAQLRARLARIAAWRERLLHAPASDGRDAVTPAFLEWYEEMFDADLRTPDEVSA